MSGRRARGEDSICLDTTRQLWRGQVALTPGSDGRRRSKTVSGRTRAEVVEKLRAVHQGIDAGVQLMHREVPLAQDWSRTWLGVSGSPHLQGLDPRQLRGRCEPLRHPSHRDDPARPAHDRRRRGPLGPAARPRAFDQHGRRGRSNVAGRLQRGGAALVEGPQPGEERSSPQGGRERDRPTRARRGTQRVIEAAKQHRNAARWTVALALGLRQGEACGLRWQDVDLDRRTIHIPASARPSPLEARERSAWRQPVLRPVNRCKMPGAQGRRAPAGRTEVCCRHPDDLDPRELGRGADRPPDHAGRRGPVSPGSVPHRAATSASSSPAPRWPGRAKAGLAAAVPHPAGRRHRSSARPRRPSHCGDLHARPRGRVEGSHGDDGLVQHGDDPALPARGPAVARRGRNPDGGAAFQAAGRPPGRPVGRPFTSSS